MPEATSRAKNSIDSLDSKQSENSRSSSRRRSSKFGSLDSFQRCDEDFNTKTTNIELHEIVRGFDSKPARAMAHLQSLVNRFGDSDFKKRWLKNWVDVRGLDLLHCAIISEKPSVIAYLVHDTYLFPPSHVPRNNPYAHVAAMLGYIDCLEAVLTYRPEDYFAASAPHHAVKLPPDVMRRLKLGSESGMANKTLERVVRMVKYDTATAERKIAASKLVEDNSLEREIKDLETSYTESRRHRRMSYNRISGNVIIPPVLPRSYDSIPSVKLPNILKPKQKKETKVTVYIDVFNDDTLDRVENRLPLTSIASGSNGQAARSPLKENKKHMRSGFSRKSPVALPGGIELGVRRIKKYKEFIPVFETKSPHSEDPRKYMGKTPLTMAAEKNHLECVKFLLKRFHLNNGICRGSKDTLTLAANARSPEALAILLKSNISNTDYQSAVLVSLREMYPDSLRVLLTLGKKRAGLFEGTNLFHTLYTQSLQAKHQYEMLPEMTRVLIQCSEEVNARWPPRTFPLYTLIQCAFNVIVGQESMHYLKCLKLLLNAKANPHFDEHIIRRSKSIDGIDLIIQRPAFFSAIHCVLASAVDSVDHSKLGYWSQIMLHKFIEAIEMYDKTPRRIDDDLLFMYMSYACRLGLNRRILRTILRYGANPDHVIDGKYPINFFFDELLPYLTKFDVKHKHQSYDDILDTLLILCRAMTQRHLHTAVVYFLDHHLYSTPVQVLGLSRKFCYYTNKMIMSPRSLSHIVKNFIWITCGRNSKRVYKLPISQEYVQSIFP